MLPKILEDNLSIPVVGAPLFIISRPDLVIARDDTRLNFFMIAKQM